MSGDPSRLPVVLCWHMHQPDYRGSDGHDYQLPWVYLHGLKDYSDMAAHLEAHPGGRAVVNFAPTLLDQLSDYAEQIKGWLERGRKIRDPLLAALAGPGLPLDSRSRRELLEACLRANEKHLVNRFPPLRRLVDLARWTQTHPASIHYLNDQFLVDLLVWYHLAWTAESIRKNDLRIQSLQNKQSGYTLNDRRQLVALIGEQLAAIVPRYRRLAERGQIELSVTPYGHPILPLLLDIGAAREAMPEADLPELKTYPGGEARARWHIRKGLESFQGYFGFRPAGCWPAEGAVSEDSLRLLEEEGFLWAASGQQVLHNSLAGAPPGGELTGNWLHQPYRLHEGRLHCFFRDDGLSDLIGFTYAEWHADDAVDNLLEHLETIDEATQAVPNRVVAIILDGENAWEYFPHNGDFFLSALYAGLAEHPRVDLTTFSDCLPGATQPAASLDRLVAGSWVYGTLSTWIGDPDKNRAWDMLGEAKATFDRMAADRAPAAEQLEQWQTQLARCEGSDWFWWLGDYNPGDAVRTFERLFRCQLRQLYKEVGEKPPGYLSRVFARGSGSPEHGGTMRKN